MYIQLISYSAEIDALIDEVKQLQVPTDTDEIDRTLHELEAERQDYIYVESREQLSHELEILNNEPWHSQASTITNRKRQNQDLVSYCDSKYPRTYKVHVQFDLKHSFSHYTPGQIALFRTLSLNLACAIEPCLTHNFPLYSHDYNVFHIKSRRMYGEIAFDTARGEDLTAQEVLDDVVAAIKQVYIKGGFERFLKTLSAPKPENAYFFPNIKETQSATGKTFLPHDWPAVATQENLDVVLKSLVITVKYRSQKASLAA